MKKLNFFIVMLLACALLVSAEPTLITLKDISNNQIIDDVAIYITAQDFTYTYYLPEGQILSLSGLPDEKIEIRVDDYSTTGIDYFDEIDPKIKTLDETIVFLRPVGSIRGSVKDSLDNVVPFASIKCECGKFSCPVKTDEFGSFFMDKAEVGSCKIYATYKGSTGSIDINLKQGDLLDLEILLDKSILQIDDATSPVLITVIIIAIFVIVFFIFKKKRSKRRKTGELDSEVKIVQARFQDKKVAPGTEKVLATLSENEKNIVNYLLDHDNSSFQANIRHSFGIPRTTLARTIEQLQKKNIISVEKHGKSVKITLTDFFLSEG